MSGRDHGKGHARSNKFILSVGVGGFELPLVTIGAIGDETKMFGTPDGREHSSGELGPARRTPFSMFGTDLGAVQYLLEWRKDCKLDNATARRSAQLMKLGPDKKVVSSWFIEDAQVPMLDESESDQENPGASMLTGEFSFYGVEKTL